MTQRMVPCHEGRLDVLECHDYLSAPSARPTWGGGEPWQGDRRPRLRLQLCLGSLHTGQDSLLWSASSPLGQAIWCQVLHLL